LDDVQISAPTNSQILKYDSGTSKWINATNPAGITAINQASDFDNTVPKFEND